MSPEEARDRFSEAFEGDLDEEAREAFDAALAADEDLEADYRDFVETFQLVGRLGETDEEPPDLLHGVQERLRRRSRGRYYRDRFAKRAGPGWMMPVLVAVAALLVLAVAWYVMQTTVVLESDAAAPNASEQTESDAE